MKMEKWSGYDKYMVLADNSEGSIRCTYASYLNYIKVLEVLNGMAYTDKSTYSYNSNIYKKKITAEDAKKIIHNVAICRWTDNTAKMKIIASQLGVFL
tara:strand:- start:63 stop:356 length:294 start_codon:yes stop_codon:yes gene_type:complete